MISSILSLTAESVDVSYQRCCHSATLIDKTLYLYGGKTDFGNKLVDNTTDSNDLWTLDITQSFDVFSPPWKKVESSNLAPKVARHSATYGGKNNEILVIFGGYVPNPTTAQYFFVLDTTTWVWETSYTPKNLELTWPPFKSLLTPNSTSQNANSTLISNSSTDIPHSTTTTTKTTNKALAIGLSVAGGIIIFTLIGIFYFFKIRKPPPTNLNHSYVDHNSAHQPLSDRTQTGRDRVSAHEIRSQI
ncbi:hypothetical protein G9A89_021288 [Geosiphon pyriformis]|nr:hypothetical protein G9A89_021288 [Geosiphon pyriformis]